MTGRAVAAVLDDAADGDIDVLVEAAGWSALAGAEGLARRAVAAALAVARVDEQVSVCVLLANDGEVAELNRNWRGKDGATNVLSFPAPRGMVPAGTRRPLGDIALAWGVAAAEARAQGKTLENHVTHLIIHAVLHLVGYDHASDEAAAAMQALEIEALAGLGIADPYEADVAGAC